MKNLVFVLLFLSLFSLVMAQSIPEPETRSIAQAWLNRLGSDASVQSYVDLAQGSSASLARVYQLKPQGFVVVTTDQKLPPVLAYSLNSSFDSSEQSSARALLTNQLELRLRLPISYQDAAIRQRQDLLNDLTRDDFQQWPPDGSSVTGGWVKTRWNQTGPYNALCPMDPVSNSRSLAGCPAVAMAQIFNYHQQLNGTLFSDADDYYHNYSGRQYWIDNDHEAQDFPSWDELNSYMTGLADTYWQSQAPEAIQKAALVYAAGAAAQQVFSSQGSGTFAVSQAFTAIQRFGFSSAELITVDSPELWSRIIQNIQEAKPVLYAAVTPAWDAGHNMVLDGYNTDDFYHVNFGWGGSSDGWFLLPSSLPYDLSVVEGVVLDIVPPQHLLVMPEEMIFETAAELSQGLEFELLNLSDQALTIEAVECPSGAELSFTATIEGQSLPYLLASGQSLYGTLSGELVSRTYNHYELRIKHSRGYQVHPVLVNAEISSAGEEELLPPAAVKLRAYPNPFTASLTVELAGEIKSGESLEIFNLRGQKVAEQPAKSGVMNWEARDAEGRNLAPGIYLMRLKSQPDQLYKVLKN
ncbi:MAG: C10 family peptidase [Candidatus Cloacimonadota bacterium]